MGHCSAIPSFVYSGMAIPSMKRPLSVRSRVGDVGDRDPPVVGDEQDVEALPSPRKAGLVRAVAHSKRLGSRLLNPARRAHHFFQHAAARLSKAGEALPGVDDMPSVRGVVGDAQEKTSKAATEAVDRVVAVSGKALETVTPLADRLLSITEGLLASRLSDDLNGLLANLVTGPATIYDKAMDAGYLATSIGGGNHRMFDGGHSFLGAFQAVRGASSDDTVIQEAMGFLEGMFKDMTTPKGLPITTWDKARYDQVAEFLKSNFGIPKDWFYDLNSYDAAGLLGGIVGVLATALSWNRADTESFSKLVGGMALPAVLRANPLLLIVTVVALARAFHKAHRTGDYTAVADGAFKGAVGAGASLAAASQIAVLGGPAGLGLLAGVCAGILAHKATEKVGIAQVGRFAAESATSAAEEVRQAASKYRRSAEAVLGIG